MKQRDWSGIPGEVGGEQAPTMRGGPAGQANQGLALLSRMRSYILVVFEALRLSNIAEGMGETLSVAEIHKQPCRAGDGRLLAPLRCVAPSMDKQIITCLRRVLEQNRRCLLLNQLQQQ